MIPPGQQTWISGDKLYDACHGAVGRRVSYKGTNGDEYHADYGKPMEGSGICLRVHDSHGLCIIVKGESGEVCIDPHEIMVI